MAITPIMATAPMPKIVGKALYLELVNNPDAPEGSIGYWGKGGVKQVIILPQTLDAVGIAQPVQIWDRVVSPHSPRSQWDNNTIRSFVKLPTSEHLEKHKDSYHLPLETYSNDELLALTDPEKVEIGVRTLNFRVKQLLVDSYNLRDSETGDYTNHATQTWIVRDSKPLAVEITDEEIELARSGTTPQSIIRRIQKARVSAGFPEKLTTK
jgi:hypothetical protein